MNEINALSNYEELRYHFFGFFKHQMKKVALDGTSFQIKDFFRYVVSYYKFPYLIKVYILKMFLYVPALRNRKTRTKYVNFIFALLYSPKDIFNRIIKK